ncbi:MAG TPA: GNAT family N-acetyltransferase [Chitinophagaceae bacterium]
MHKSEKIDFEKIVYEKLSTSNWPLFEKLLGEKGGCGGCWCMTHRLLKADFEKNKYEGNKKQLYELVENAIVGFIAIYHNEAIGWLSFAPREQFIRLDKSRVHKRIDDKPVWSITCFFIKKEFRNKGMSAAMIEAAKRFAKKNKIKIIESYPVKPYTPKMPDAFAWTGIYKTFKDAGFEIASEASKVKPVMRFVVT